MGPWAKLAIAIVVEVIATVALRQSHGLTKPGWVVLMVAGYVISFYLLSRITGQLEIGLIYAVWSATGTALVAIIGIAAFGESVNPLKIIGLALVILGVVALNVSAAGHDHPGKSAASAALSPDTTPR
jgi:small multidrug resistance pump